MCKYVDGPNLQPGWGCGFCHTYNGLQRQHCKACDHLRCSFELPSELTMCSNCGFGEQRTDPMTRSLCPVCGSYLFALIEDKE